MWKKFFGISSKDEALNKKKAAQALNALDGVRILKHAQAMRVVFFYPGEEGTYVDNCMVTLFENGVVHLRAKSEETTTHLHHCEILWRYEVPADAKKDGSDKLRVVKFKSRERARDPEPPTEPSPSN